MIELQTYRYVVNQMLEKAGYVVVSHEDVELEIRSCWHKRLSARECANKIIGA